MFLGRRNSIFSCLNLLSGYWQVELEPASREITVFRMSFCLKSAPFTFERMINNLFAGKLGNATFAYLDDLLNASKDLETHLKTLQAVLQRLQEACLIMKLAKCEFVNGNIKFLGNELDGEGIHTLGNSHFRL